MAGTIEDRVTELCKPLIESLGLQLWGVRYRQGGAKGILEIYVETPDGVSADQCGEALTVLSPALDAAILSVLHMFKFHHQVLIAFIYCR